MKTSMEVIQSCLVEALLAAGGKANLNDTIATLEASRLLTAADREPQKGHEQESSFAYRCRWGITRLRNSGVVKPSAERGVVELSDGRQLASVSPPPLGTTVVSKPTASLLEVEGEEQRVWIFQANPKFYRILEALQSLDRMQFLTNRYKDRIQVGDIVLLWMSGNHAGVYAQARVIEGVAKRKSDGDDTSFWADPSAGSTTKSRVVLTIEKRFLGNPLLKSVIVAAEGLANLMILRQPNGTNFRVDTEEWERLRPLMPTKETFEPAREVLTWAMKRARGGKLYNESCNELLERFVAETFADGEEHSRDEITSWFAANYPLFKPITVQCHVEKFTTNFQSRVHYNATAEHDLLFRVDNDWSRLRLYCPHDDPAPIHDKPDAPKGSKAKASTKVKQVSPLDRNRRLLAHLATFGELTPGDLEDLGLDEPHLGDWLDSMVARRPEAHVVTPLFLHLIDGDAGPSAFTTRLAARFMGEHLRRHTPDSIPSSRSTSGLGSVAGT